MLNDDQLLRYSRQLMVEEFDLPGQEALSKARILVVGCGCLLYTSPSPRDRG